MKINGIKIRNTLVNVLQGYICKNEEVLQYLPQLSTPRGVAEFCLIETYNFVCSRLVFSYEYDKEFNLDDEIKNSVKFISEKYKLVPINTYLYNNLFIENYTSNNSLYFDNLKYNEEQIREIKEGLEQGLDVSVYAKPYFKHLQMMEIRLGLERGLDVSIYASPNFHSVQMLFIRVGLMEGLDVSSYANPNFHYFEMWKMRDRVKQEVNNLFITDKK